MAFSEETIRFLAELAGHNERAWFEAHRAEYERALLEPAKELVVELGALLRQLDPRLQALPRVNGSVHALERKRFFPGSKQPPYREYLDLWFWAGRRRTWDNSGFFLRLSASRLVLAAGMVEFQPATKARYREQVLDESRGAALVAAVETVRASGYVVGGESYKRTPPGVPAAHPRAALLKHGGLFASLDVEHPAELCSPGFAAFAFEHFARMAPLHAWLAALVAG